MGGFSLTVSLRNDELKKIEAYMAEFGMKRHEVLKLAIRSFLFPDEAEHQLNGVKGHVDDSFLMGKSPEAVKDRARAQKLRERGLHNVNLSPPPVVIYKSEEDLAKEAEEERVKKEIEEKKAKARAEADEWFEKNVFGQRT